MTKRRWKHTQDYMNEFKYAVADTPVFKEGQGWPVYMTPMRKPASRKHLNRIMFPALLEDEGLSLATLLALPGQALVGTIPDYKGQMRDDEISVLIRLRGREHVMKVSSLAANISDVPLTVRFDRRTLASLGANGRVDFSYDVKSAATGATARSPVSSLNVLLHDAPETLKPPMVRTTLYGVVRETDIVPELAVDIPAPSPLCKPGDRVRLRIGDAWFSPVPLGACEVMIDPMARVLVSCEDILAIAGTVGAQRFTVDVAYELDRDGIVSPSPAISVLFDFSPGGPRLRPRG